MLAKHDAHVIKADGSEIGKMFRVSSELQALDLANFQELPWQIEAGGKKLGTVTVEVEHYVLVPNSERQPGVPQGRVEKFE